MMKESNIHLGYFDPDENKHVPNPGMGLIGYVFSDHMHTALSRSSWVWTETNDNNRELDRKSFEEFLKLPYVDNIYIRVEWCDIHKSPGRIELPREFRWVLESVEKYGKRWSFRVMNSSPHSRFETSVPEFLLEKMEYETYWHNHSQVPPWPKKYPKYTEEYFKWWGELVNLMADRFDKHPLLEFCEISGFGHWGEAHHYASYTGPNGPIYNKDPENVEYIVDRLINLHLEAFRATPSVMNVHFTEYESGMKHLRESGVWIRRDSFQVSFSTYEWENICGIGPGQAMLWEPYLVSHNGLERTVPMSYDGVIYRWLDSKACYTSLGFNVWDAILLHRYNMDGLKKLISRIGYRLRPTIVWRRYLEEGRQQIAVALVNDGCANPPGSITLTVVFPSGKEVKYQLEKGEPAVGSRPIARFDIPKIDEDADVDKCIILKAEIKLKEKSYPVRWATKQYLQDPYQIVLPLYKKSDMGREIPLPGSNACGFELRYDRKGKRIDLSID